jgi:hypothetical protein
MTPCIQGVIFGFRCPILSRLDRFDRQQLGWDVIILIVNCLDDSFGRLKEEEIVALITLDSDGEVIR